MSAVALMNGRLCESLPLGDRGFAYGDGLFETVRVVDGQGLLWEYHLKRLVSGCERLRIPLPDDLESNLPVWLRRLLNTTQSRDPSFRADDFILKIVVTRGSGGRGYRPLATGVEPSIYLSLHAVPSDLKEKQQNGISAKLLDYRLVSHPVLAGLKHLNRLDQVLASLELRDEDEGLLLNQAGFLIEGTKSNLLLYVNDEFVTPELHGCGVEGVMRQWLIAPDNPAGIQVNVAPVKSDVLQTAKGLAVINSVMGVCPVSSLNGLEWVVPEQLRHLQHAVHSQLRF